MTIGFRNKRIDGVGLPSLGERLVKTAIAGLNTEVEDFLDDDVVRWIWRHYRIPETKDNRFPLGEYQKRVLRSALTRDSNGNFPYSIILWSDIKKSTKSSIAAAVTLWMAFNTEWGSIKVVANDLKQADSRVSYYIRRCIELNPAMREIVKVRPSGYLVELPNHARIESIPVDPTGEAGGNDDMVVFSELWGAKGGAAERLWTEMTLSPTKMGKSFRWVETYAGYRGEASLLETLWKQGVVEGKLVDWANEFDPVLPCYVNESAKMFCLWNTTPRLSFQTPEYYAQEAAVLLPNEFQRVHRNQWVSSMTEFVPEAWWLACEAKGERAVGWKELGKDQPVIIAIDAGVTNDNFGLIIVSGRDSEDEIVDVRYVRRWEPPKGGKIDFSEVEDEIRRILNEYNVVEVCYDPYQLEDLASRLRKDLIARLYAFQQGKPRLMADKKLYGMIRDRKIYHHGERDLHSHICNANVEIDGDKIRLVKRSNLLHIDLAVCLSMATARCTYWRL